MFSALGVDTLSELRRAGLLTMPFPDMHDLGDALAAAGFAEPVMDTGAPEITWGQWRTLELELRALGGNPQRDASAGCARPAARRHAAADRAAAAPGGALAEPARAVPSQDASSPNPDAPLALTFEVIYGHAWCVAHERNCPTATRPSNSGGPRRAAALPRDGRTLSVSAGSLQKADRNHVRRNASAAADSGAGLLIARCGGRLDPCQSPLQHPWIHQASSHQQEWLLSATARWPRRSWPVVFASLGSVSLMIAGMFAASGAWLVLPFAVVELLALGVAFVVYARHAADYERIVLCRGCLMVETCRATGWRGLKPRCVDPGRVPGLATGTDRAGGGGAQDRRGGQFVPESPAGPGTAAATPAAGIRL